MTSLIERLRLAGDEEAATALEQARGLVEILDSPFYGKNQDAALNWLRLIDGEQAKEERHDR